jgi:uncharacterized membrane protein
MTLVWTAEGETGQHESSLSAAAPAELRPPAAVLLIILVAAATLFACGAVRHYLLRSGAFDLGFFDQAIYLISQGAEPVSSLHGFHVLGDHAALILYPFALLYCIWPDPYMLLASQAIILAAGA